VIHYGVQIDAPEGHKSGRNAVLETSYAKALGEPLLMAKSEPAGFTRWAALPASTKKTARRSSKCSSGWPA
jgi:hypothetical protein